MNRIGVALIAAVAFVLPGMFPRAAAAQDARAIMEEAQRRTDTTSQHYEGLLQVFDSAGKISDKRWTFDRIGAHGTSKSLLNFTAPAEVKGVALLVINHGERASDQWMWTPAVGRERRIALQDRSQRFFGTDFSFEDLEERDTGQYDYSIAGEETTGRRGVLEDRVAPEEDEGVAVHAVAGVGSQGQLCARADRELRQERSRAAAEVPADRERPGHLDRARARDDRRAHARAAPC